VKKNEIRAFAGAFVAFAVANDFEKAIGICRNFSITKDETLFLFQIAVVLAKLGDKFNEDESHALNKITDFFNELLREGEIRP
tara:strand:+ start:1070 stop:1318 length:249 start_codon:yes stop_codon:yes gene_type:complete